MVLWFVVLAVLGALAILQVAADSAGRQSRAMAWRCSSHEPWTAFVALGSVVLAVTGCEALYADMGHFGAPRHPLGLALLRLSRPGAELFRAGRAAACRIPKHAPFLFYALVPAWAHYPDGGAGDDRHHHRLARR